MTLASYLRKPTMVQSNFKANNSGIEFPEITICNFNPVNRDAVARSGQRTPLLACTLL